MTDHLVTVHPSRAALPRSEQLAWKLAETALGTRTVDADVAAMAANRLIDDAAVAVASLDRAPVANARAQALAHPHPRGATPFGHAPDVRVHAEWAAWANAVAVRELDFHDTFLAADYAHPGDAIPPLLAVAQQTGRDGAALTRGIVAAYEVHVALVKSICLHCHKIDHMAHLCPATAAGLATMLDLDVATTYQAINQAVHVAFSTRQSRKGTISSWKAYVPGHSALLAVTAVDRAMRGEAAPAPIYEGEDSVLAWLLDGPDARYVVPLPDPDDPRRAILETYTKAHSAEYQAQAFIDLAFDVRRRLPGGPDAIDVAAIEEVVVRTSHHTHHVIGTGANDPEKFDPDATRETLDHSLMYILAVALQDGVWHHVDSYAPARAHRPDTVALWHKIRTEEDPTWTARYRATDPGERAFGGEMTVTLTNGETVHARRDVADAHPNGAAPFARADYVAKFRTLAEGVVPTPEQDRFLHLAERLDTLAPDEVRALTVAAPHLANEADDPATQGGIFR
ncbi:MAG: MmgE/PrpD family protein [Trueperaceae bacterium]|nr:MmgE/PrpD family protein [Trueperaceae bacterium]